ncbi:hypothetical protein OG609_40090 [Streptomyces sp. NBC_01224]|uniref:hypothetical protein n=1 Tax=Streptomyces sp. NBC_01224 TaxID=2903783 RepID=UPI002E15D5B9|nr:hypothetical protein OG609_40090 [Streptomyces sp. NBC_01224]
MPTALIRWSVWAAEGTYPLDAQMPRAPIRAGAMSSRVVRWVTAPGLLGALEGVLKTTRAALALALEGGVESERSEALAGQTLGVDGGG